MSSLFTTTRTSPAQLGDVLFYKESMSIENKHHYQKTIMSGLVRNERFLSSESTTPYTDEYFQILITLKQKSQVIVDQAELNKLPTHLQETSDIIYVLSTIPGYTQLIQPMMAVFLELQNYIHLRIKSSEAAPAVRSLVPSFPNLTLITSKGGKVA